MQHNPPAIAVRRASITDADAVAPLFDAYRQFYRQPADLEQARQFIRDRLERNDSVVLLGTAHDGCVVGFTQLYPSFSSVAARRLLILNDLFVKPEFRRLGLGAALLSAAAREGVRAGAIRMLLSTEIANQGAQRLYESQGWRRDRDFYSYTLSLVPEGLDE